MARVWILGAAAAIVVALLAMGCGDDDDSQANCDDPDALFRALHASGGGPSAFTMGIRVNKSDEVDDIESEIGDLIESRDVFVINTEYEGSTPDDWKDSLEELSDKFPCNRVAALNGVGTDSSKPGYLKALAGESELDAVLVDWEPDVYETAGKGSWSPSLATNLERIREQMILLAEELKGQETGMGLVPDYLPPWDYGTIQRQLALSNYPLGTEHHGYQVVQTQPNCGDPGAPGPLIGGAAAAIREQYRPLYGYAATKNGWTNVPGDSDSIGRHLGFEVAFSTSPNPNSSEAVDRVGPEQAARCSAEVVARAGGAVLYWADPSALKAMFETPVGKRLRPPSSS